MATPQPLNGTITKVNRNERDIEKLAKRLNAVELTVAGLVVKASAFGALSGSIVVGAGALIKALS